MNQTKQRKKTNGAKRFLSLILSLAVVFGMFAFNPTTAKASGPINYIDYTITENPFSITEVHTNTGSNTVTEIDDTFTGNTLTAGWYVVTATALSTNCIYIVGDVHLILADGCSWTVTGSGSGSQNSAGIHVTGSDALTIYAQSTVPANMGTLNVTSMGLGAGIGGNHGIIGVGESCGTVTINGGNVSAIAASSTNVPGAGIGGGGGTTGGGSGTININGGTVTAACNAGGVAIGAGIGSGGSGNTAGPLDAITIRGGTVNATSFGGTNTWGAGIGGGNGTGIPVVISGANTHVTAQGGPNSIGSGDRSNDGRSLSVTDGATLTLNSGTNSSPQIFNDCTINGSGAGALAGSYIGIKGLEDTVYDGAAQTPVVVTFGGIPLTDGADYDITYANNTNVGSASATVTPKNTYSSYKGDGTYTFNITKATAPTPTATFDAYTMELSGVTTQMQYSVDGELTWSSITADPFDMSSETLSVTDDIKIKEIGDGANINDSAVQTIDLTKASTQTTVGKVDETALNANNGKITGVDNTMEYKLATDPTYTDITGAATEITWLAPGTYQVRVKGNGTVLASDEVTVDIQAFIDSVKPTVLTVSPDGNDETKTGSIEINFDEKMNTAVGTVSLDNSIGVLSGGTWSNNDTTYTVSYTVDDWSTQYTLSIYDFEDLSGNVMDQDDSHSFTTMAEPQKPTVLPANSPRTGDYNNIFLFSALLIGAGTLLKVLKKREIRKKKNNFSF